MKLKYDHAFTPDPGHRFHRRMKALGFLLEPDEVEHPNRQFCRFVIFRESMSELPVYLEFVDARDKKHPLPPAGLSFRARGSLERFWNKLRARGLKGKFTHKNYDWKADSRARLPGWNFVSFQHVGFRTLYPWITEYENRKPSPKKIAVRRHPNGVRRLIALEIEVNDKGSRFFEKLLGRKLKTPLKMPGGQTLHFTIGRQTRLTTIVLESKSFAQVRRRRQHDQEIMWRGRPGLLVENPENSWNLIIV